MTKVERSYHDNGLIAGEVTLVDGVPHGVTRHWHPNGVLASEIPLDHGTEEGTVKQWNDKGELLGSCEITKGTGILRSWHPNGKLMGEMQMIDGKLTGRSRAYFDDGEVAGDTYWLDDEKVSRKRYLEACQRNHTLPRYKDLPVEPKQTRHRKRKSPGTNAANSVDDLAAKLLKEPNVREALSWLTETRNPSRSLGEATGQDASLRLVKKLYALGAVTVYAIKIDGRPDEDQNSGRLVLVLPQNTDSRKKLLRFCGRLAREGGFDPDRDVGQRYVLLMLD